MRVRPKPEEQPVMSHVRGRLGMVNVGPVDIFGVLSFSIFLFFFLFCSPAGFLVQFDYNS